MAGCRHIFAGVLVALLLCAGGARAGGRPGRIQFSDGETMAGILHPASAQGLRLHGPEGLRTFGFDRLREVRFVPARERMERKWRFVEAGRTEKEFSGEPYPVRHLDARVVLVDGQSATGHLYTTSLLVEGSNETRRVVLRAKERGKEGQLLSDLVHPVRICLDGGVTGGSATPLLLDVVPAEAPVRELAVLTHGALARLAARRGAAAGRWSLPSPFGAGLFIAARVGEDDLVAGWPGDAGPSPEMERALQGARDFFDRRELLGVLREGADTVYTLVLLSRAAETTLDADQNRPWRLGIWRWRLAEDGRLLVAGRGYLLRGIVRPGAAPPRVTLSPALWASGRDAAGTLRLPLPELRRGEETDG